MTTPNWQALQNHIPREVQAHGHRRSSVLIPILDRPGYPVLFTQRSFELKHHAGQFSFPGGVVETGESPWETALREANEEIGLPENRVSFVGQLDDVFSPLGFHIKCMVGLVQPFELHLNPAEVARVITVPFAELFEPCYHEQLPYKGRTVHFFHFPAGLVWGVTGQILYTLKHTVNPQATKPAVDAVYSRP